MVRVCVEGGKWGFRCEGCWTVSPSAVGVVVARSLFNWFTGLGRFLTRRCYFILFADDNRSELGIQCDESIFDRYTWTIVILTFFNSNEENAFFKKPPLNNSTILRSSCLSIYYITILPIKFLNILIYSKYFKNIKNSIWKNKIFRSVFARRVWTCL